MKDYLQSKKVHKPLSISIYCLFSDSAMSQFEGTHTCIGLSEHGVWINIFYPFSWFYLRKETIHTRVALLLHCPGQCYGTSAQAGALLFRLQWWSRLQNTEAAVTATVTTTTTHTKDGSNGSFTFVGHHIEAGGMIDNVTICIDQDGRASTVQVNGMLQVQIIHQVLSQFVQCQSTVVPTVVENELEI